MKRLIRKSDATTLIAPPMVGGEVRIDDDPSLEGLDMNDMSLPQNRDGAVLVDVNSKKVYIGHNGETHAQLLEKYFNIPENSNELKLDTDSYVAPGVYLKDFLGQESIILYSYLDGAEDVITSEYPNMLVYGENWDFDDTIMRLAKKSRP